VEFVERGSEREVEQTDAGAAWTWGEVLEAADRRLGLEGTWEAQVRVDVGPNRRSSRNPNPAAMLNRALYATPLYFGDVSLDRPVVQGLMKALNRVRGAGSVPQISKLPPGLPAFSPISGWRRERVALDSFAEIISVAFEARGYAEALSRQSPAV
jgi:hypothetical protein